MFGSKEFLALCKTEVASYYNSLHLDEIRIEADDVYVVWYSKTLQNQKALLSTPVPDGMYYECTYNGDKSELYFDAYKKLANRCVHLA